MFTLCDSSWDDDHDTSIITGGFLLFYQVGVVDHSCTMPEPLVTSSTKAEYIESCMTCMATSHMHMTLNHIEEVEDESKEDKPFDIYINIRSAVDIIITFKNTNYEMHIRRRFHL
jgi:hypothetical protein